MSQDFPVKIVVTVTLDDGDRTRRMLTWPIPPAFSQDALLATGWAVDGLKALKIIDVGKLHEEQGKLITLLREEQGFDVFFGSAQ